MTKPFVITRNAVIHDARHANEQCNLDDAKKMKWLDRGGLEIVCLVGIPNFCGHCWPDDLGSLPKHS